MSNFFLLNEALDTDFFTFKEGMLNLNAIEKNDNHKFRKHSSVYDLANYCKLYENYGQIEQLLIVFIEQLSQCDTNVNTEDLANSFCASEVNGFLGIEFSQSDISIVKQISNNEKYLEWIFHYLPNIDKLKFVIENYKFSNTFEKEFLSASEEIQLSIIDEFLKAKNRNLPTPFFPDTKIVKDVTQDNFNYKIMELRIYSPTALRVYFNELNGNVNLISIELKSNPDQSSDIKKAYTKYTKNF